MSEWELVPDKESEWELASNDDSSQSSIIDKLPATMQLGLKSLISYGMNKKKPLSQRGKESLASIGRGFKDIGEGAKQAYLSGFGTPEEYSDFTKQAEKERQLFNKTPAGIDPLNQIMREQVAGLPLYAATGPMATEASLLKKVLSSAAGGGAAGAMKFAPEDESRLANIVKYGGLSALLPLISKSPEILKNITPTAIAARFMKSPLSREELLRNLEVTKGTQTGLGEVIGSPTAKRLQENILTKIPFTGGNDALQQTGKEILSRGESLVNNQLPGINPDEVSDKLGKGLIETKEREQKRKNLFYTEANNRAEQENINLRLPNFTNQVNEHIADLQNSNILQFQPEVKKLLRQLNILKEPLQSESGIALDETGFPLQYTITKHPSLSEANIVAAKLRELGNKYASSPTISERHAAGVLKSLSKTLKSDIKTALKEQGSAELNKMFEDAEKNYAENYSDLLDKEIHKFTSGKKSPEDLVSTFLKTSNTADKADQLEKLMRVLDPEQQRLVRYSYFSRAMEGPEDMRVVNPNKLSTLWKNLGQRQKKILVPDEGERRELDNFSLLVGKNQKAINLMWNPQTGQMNNDIITALMMTNPVTSLKEMLAGRMANKLLTGEKSREEIVKGILKRK